MSDPLTIAVSERARVSARLYHAVETARAGATFVRLRQPILLSVVIAVSGGLIWLVVLYATLAATEGC